jgi:hypothetical protein
MPLMAIGQLIGHLSKQHPYLDPGSGSILIQLLIAGLLGAGILLRASWSRIMKLFGRDKKDQSDQEDDE